MDISKLCYGISSLHSWIRFFEFFLHLGYKLEIKKWHPRSNEDKISVKISKINIQKMFKSKLGFKVDVSKQGFGSSSDGNTAREIFRRKFNFSQYPWCQWKTDTEMLYDFTSDSQRIQCGCLKRQKNYCLNVAKQIRGIYGNAHSVHKILIDDYMIIEWTPLLIGELSEDTLESRNKNVKAFRKGFARKFSREKNME